MRRIVTAAMFATLSAVTTVTMVFGSAGTATAVPGPGPGMCQYLGEQYPIYYPCDQYQPWLPYGTVDNPPAGAPDRGGPFYSVP